jgi:hypothetical protein
MASFAEAGIVKMEKYREQIKSVKSVDWLLRIVISLDSLMKAKLAEIVKGFKRAN